MRKRCSSVRGFSLVEITLALGVTAIALLTMFSLLPIGIRTNQNASQQSASADILSLIATDLRATPVTTPRGSATASPQLNIAIPANPVPNPSPSTLYFTEAGQSSTTPQPTSRYRATITFLANGTDARTATFIDLKLTWPAAATVLNAAGSAESFVALDRN